MQIANSKKKDTIEKTSAKVPNISTNFKRSQDGKSTEAPPETLSPSRSSTSSWLVHDFLLHYFKTRY